MPAFNLRDALWVAHSCGRLGIKWDQTSNWISSPAGGICVLKDVLVALDPWLRSKHSVEEITVAIAMGVSAMANGEPIPVPNT